MVLEHLPFPVFSHKLIKNSILQRWLYVFFLPFLLHTALLHTARAQVVTTLAGQATAGFADGIGTAAQFNFPFGICSDGAGNLFVADAINHRIRRIVIATGFVTTLAGSTTGFADGTGAAAQFNGPNGICTDGAGNLFVVDQQNHRIRRIVIATGAVSTVAGSTAGFADGTGAAAQFNVPFGICNDGVGNLFVTDALNHRIRRIVIATGVVTTLAGSTAGFMDGTGTAAQFNVPFGVCSDGAGNLFVTDGNNGCVRRIVIATGVVTTLTAAVFNNPYGLCSDGTGNLFVADALNNIIRRIVITTGAVTTFAGSLAGGFADGTGAAAQFSQPTDVCSDGAGNLFVVDQLNHRIRRISPPPPPAPIITSFTPARTSPGTTVVITGTGFTGATAVSFGGAPAASFIVNSDTQITAVVGSGTVGTGGAQLVIVSSPAGVSTLGGSFIGSAGASSNAASGVSTPQSAVLGSFSPGNLSFGTPITISGSGFTGATGLLIGGIPVANFVVINDGTITAVVGGVPVSDRVQLIGGLGASLDMRGLGLTYNRLAAPSIISLTPAIIQAIGSDTTLTITGLNFLAGARAQISDGAMGLSMNIQNLSASRVGVTLPSTLQSLGIKTITLTNPDGQTASTTVTITQGAALSLRAESLLVSTTASGRMFSIRLSGANIFRTAQASLNSAPALITVLSSTQAIVEVPASLNSVGGITLMLRLANSDGQTTTATVRIERRPLPTILAVTLQNGGVMRIRGINFLGGIFSTLGSSPLTLISQANDTALTVQIPSSFRLMTNSPTVSLLVQNPDGSSHGVLLPRSLFESSVSLSSQSGQESTERTWENTAAPIDFLQIVAGKQSGKASQEMNIFPNPVDGELRIGGVGQRTVRVYDMRGGVVLEESTNSGVINVAALGAGVYMVVVEATDGRIARQRVVKS